MKSERIEGNLREGILRKGTQEAGKFLISLMNELEIPNYIETTILDVKDNQKYRLKIERIGEKTITEKMCGNLLKTIFKKR